MMSPFSLLAPAAPAPTDGEPALSTPGLPAGNTATNPQQSFHAVMAHVHSKTAPKAAAAQPVKAAAAPETRTNTGAVPSKTSPTLAENPAPATLLPPVSTALASVMTGTAAARSKTAKASFETIVNQKNAPVPQKASAKDSTQPPTTDLNDDPENQPDQSRTPVTDALLALIAQQAAGQPASAKNVVPNAPTVSEAPLPITNATSILSTPVKSTASGSPAPAVKPSGPEPAVPQAQSNTKATDAPKTSPAQPARAPLASGLQALAKPVEVSLFQGSATDPKQPIHSAENSASKQQPVGLTNQEPQQVAVNGPSHAAGTMGALKTETVKTGPDKNNIAGADDSSSPVTSVSVASAKAAATVTANASASNGGQDIFTAKQGAVSITAGVVADALAKAGFSGTTLTVDAAKAVTATQPADNAATQAERIGHLLSQQVVMVRQSGANNLAVSLKLDPQTELSLQLTNHNGQIEAAVRWERGDISGLENHWKDLQDSLAKQNVQLLPLENRSGSRGSSNQSESSNGANTNSSSSQNSQHESRQARRDAELTGTVSTLSKKNTATARTNSRQGWESWA